MNFFLLVQKSKGTLPLSTLLTSTYCCTVRRSSSQHVVLLPARFTPSSPLRVLPGRPKSIQKAARERPRASKSCPRRPKIRSKSARSDRPRRAQGRPRSAPGPILNQFGANLGPPWAKLGAKLGPTRRPPNDLTTKQSCAQGLSKLVVLLGELCVLLIHVL